jgi:DNA-binding transcriptional MerR regulator
MSAPALPPADELTLDALAAATGVPSRTIRFYQAKGLLLRPVLRGRVAMYDAGHVARLQLIASLQDRGLQIKAIASLLSQEERGEVAVSEWLGLDEELRAPWAVDEPRLVSRREALALLNPATPGRLATLVRLGLMEERGESYLIPRPALLGVALQMEQLGTDLETVVKASVRLRKRFAKAAAELAKQLLPAMARGGGADGERLREVRPLAMEAVRLIFAQEMERVLREWSGSGRAAKIARRGRGRSA